MHLQHTCQQCGRAFKHRNDSDNKYCTHPCYIASKRMTPERFATFVDSSGECWNWTGKINKWGYGTFVDNGKTYRASRTAFAYRYGPIPDGRYALHTCDNRSCVRNDGEPGVYIVDGEALPRVGHLFIGTKRQNSRDMLQKNRHGAVTHPEALPRGDRNGSRLHPERRPRGEMNRNSKVTAEQVREIRRRYAAGGITMERLGIEYGLKKSMIGNIVNRTSWRHVA